LRPDWTGRAGYRFPIFPGWPDQALLALLASIAFLAGLALLPGDPLLSSKADRSGSPVDSVFPILAVAAGRPFGAVAHQREPLNHHRGQFAKLGVNCRVASGSLFYVLGAQLGNYASGLRLDQRALALPLLRLPGALSMPALLLLRQRFGERLAPDIKQQIAVWLGRRNQ
jgi:hypothetical protein